MKKLLLIAAALTTMVSCSKTQVIPEETQQQEIAMKAYNQTAVKATGPVSGTTLPTDELMTIYGFYAPTVDDYNSTPYLNGVTFKFSGDRVWKGWQSLPGGQGNFTGYYWPYSGNMKIIAVYPYNAGNISCVYTTTDNTQTPPTVNPTTTTISNVDLSNTANQKDIMYSNNLYTEPVACPSASDQNLVFQHLLSQVVVAVKPTVANKIIVNNVELLGAHVRGDIVVTESTPLSITYDYDDSNPTANLTYDLVGAVTAQTGIADDDNYTQVSEKGVLVLPYNDTEKAKLSINYTFITGKAENITVTRTVNISDTWERGKKYVYNVDINSLNEITFTAEVVDWTDPDYPINPSI